MSEDHPEAFLLLRQSHADSHDLSAPRDTGS
jgi:hypothetical protein